MTKILLLTLILAFAAAAPALAQKSAYCNSGAVLAQMPELKQADSDLQGFQTQLIKKSEQMEKQFQANKAEFQRKVAADQISREDMEAGSDALYREDKGIKEFEKEAQNKVAAKREELLKPILEKLNTAVRDVAKQLGYAFVFDIRTQGQFYGKESLDLSEQVKKKLGIQVETPQKPAGPALNQRSAHYNAGALLSRMPEVKQADSDLQLFHTEVTNKGAQMTMQYQAKYIEFQRKVEYGELPPVDQQAQQAALRTEQEGIVKFEAEAKNKIAAKREELYGLILEKLNKAIRDVANELGYTFVFDSSTGNLLYADESLDLTEQVEKKLGIQVETPQKPAAPTLDQRSAYCNCKAVLSQMPEMKQADSDLQRLETQLTNKGDQMVNQYKANEGELQRKVAAGQISAKDRKAAEAALNTQIEGLQKYEEEVKNKIAAKREELYKPILEKLNKAVRDVSKELGYILVFDTSTNALLYGDESLDVTERVKTKLGIK